MPHSLFTDVCFLLYLMLEPTMRPSETTPGKKQYPTKFDVMDKIWKPISRNTIFVICLINRYLGMREARLEGDDYYSLIGKNYIIPSNI